MANKKLLRNVVIIVIISIIAYTILNLLLTDKEDLKQLSNFKIGYLFLAGVASLLPWLIHTLEMKLWTNYLNKTISFKEALRIAIATDLGSAVTPSAVGGIPVKIALLLRQGYTIPQTTFLTTILPVEDMISYIIIIIASLFIFSGEQSEVFQTIFQNFLQNWQLKLAILAALIVLLFVIWKLLMRYNRFNKSGFKEKLTRTWFETKELVALTWISGKTYFLVGILLVLIRWITTYSILLLLALGLQIETSFTALFFLQWITSVSMLLMPTPGAAGGAELAFFYVFKGIIPQNFIGIMITGWRFFNYYFVMLCAAFILAIEMLFYRKKNG